MRDGPWVHHCDPTLIEERMAAENLAARVMPRARRSSRLIARFPFVRGVALSGTISKAVFARGDDVDFFVITAPERLWICRTLLMTFKKVFLLNSRRTFCINYLVTEDHLEIPDHNLFTATEIAWVTDFLPQWKATTSSRTDSFRPSGLVRTVEALLRGHHGNTLDDRCRTLIERHNLKRYHHLQPTEFSLALRTAKPVSKHHPQSLQSQLLDRFGGRPCPAPPETTLWALLPLGERFPRSFNFFHHADPEIFSVF